MFKRLLGRVIHRAAAPAKPPFDREKALEEASRLMHAGNKHAAAAALRAFLVEDPLCVQALNDLGACLADIGDETGARAAFEQAFALDDSFLPAVVNHAKMLIDQRRSQEALPFLEHAKHSNPEFTHADAVYAGACLRLGRLDEARNFQIRAWLANFDYLRTANGHLFYSTFDADEGAIAAEHRFWAETCQPVESLRAMEVEAFGAGRLRVDAAPDDSTVGPRRIRIGYWSPDFRSHSVRYFFRPLLEAHDRERFEIFLYHDVPNVDQQTELIRAAAEHFDDVSALPDTDFYELVLSHRLDVFVELAGHTSNNRVLLLQHRFAPVQISALGYPPTTGLTTLDGKLMDRHVVGPNSARYYTERPLVLPGSFWCFDPKEDPSIRDAPPASRNGYVTFGCVGNIAKITDSVLGCWTRILAGVPGSRLLLRAINFEEVAAMDVVRARLSAAGLDLARVDLRKPEGGAAFFESYNDIDIILDTFPYNGGTTTCFATYMGVPVVSRYGESLISRMGLSILNNLDVATLAVGSDEEYVERAIALAADRPFLDGFKQTARERFRRSPLGDGRLFASQFEQACLEWIEASRSDSVPYVHQVPALPANEIIRRAFFVMRRGQDDAVRRILAHCLELYPDNGTAHVLAAQQIAGEHSFVEAANYLRSKLDGLHGNDRVAALICLARFHLLGDEPDPCRALCSELLARGLGDPIDQLQVELFASCPHALEAIVPGTGGPELPDNQRFLFCIPCDSTDRFDALARRIEADCRLPPGWTLQIERCGESRRLPSYRAALDRPDVDIVVFLQKNLEIHRPEILTDLALAMREADIVGMSGARRWRRLDWRLDAFELKAGGFMLDASERAGFVELQWLGSGHDRLVSGMAVLDGGILAISRGAAQAKRLGSLFDDELVGSEVLLEEDWTHSAGRAGCRLAVHRNLGVLVRTGESLDARYRGEARIRAAEKHGFSAFEIANEDRMAISAPVAEPALAVQWLERFMRDRS
jgi:predicted O-linked N-acetylglucosamine transferase (SPINDLY family)